MNIVVTGAAGFLGARVADALLAGEEPLLPLRELVLADARAPPPRADARARCLQVDLVAPSAAARLVGPDTHLVFHLAAVVSGQAEADFDLGLAVNLDGTRALLEAVRRRAPGARLVLASTVGVYGGELPDLVDERTALTPQTSYGAAKAAAELLVEEYSRRGFVDGRAVRLPTVTVRAGAANEAVTSFASGVVREPLAGLPALCPVPPETALWVSGPRAAVRNLMRAGALPAARWAGRRALCLPGLRVTVVEILAALERTAGATVAARVTVRPDPSITAMVQSFPSRFDCSRALAMGFAADQSFDDIIQDYIDNDLNKND